MGTYTGEAIAKMLAKQLTDPGNILWSKAEYLYPAINEAQNTILFLRPDSNSKTAEFTLMQSPTQNIPDDGFRFLNLTRNIGGKPIRKIERKDINELIPDWTTEETATEVLFYIFDIDNPMYFSIYPTPSVATIKAELVYAARPAVVADDSDKITLPDSYIAPIIEWVLFRCLSAPTARVSQAAADSHNSNFYNLLGLKRQNDSDIYVKTGK
ncbi:MAG: hypothetical protein GY737_13860 [Desulfobacteraceae bacterium]|nr:hypothetical protein [Desulfobacteraceae bacterium]